MICFSCAAPACPYCGFGLREFFTSCRYCNETVHHDCLIKHEEICPDREAWEKEQDDKDGYYEGDKWRKP